MDQENFFPKKTTQQFDLSFKAKQTTTNVIFKQMSVKFVD